MKLAVLIGMLCEAAGAMLMAKAVANVYVQGHFRCSGAFHRGLVLTTPTHVIGYPDEVRVGLSTAAKPEEDTSPRYGVEDMFFHPQYSQSKDYNLVLLKLSHGLGQAEYDVDTSPFGDSRADAPVLVGWGFESQPPAPREALLVLRPYPCPVPPYIKLRLAQGEAWFHFYQPWASTVVEGSPIFTLKNNVPHIHAINYREPAVQRGNGSDLVFIQIAPYLPWIHEVAK